MLICAAGDIHGALDRMYEHVSAFERALGAEFAWILHVGDFGIWPDPARVDRATQRHDGAGDFPTWWADRRAAPRRTLFIKGNHEDFDWLESRRQSGLSEVLPNLFWLPNGHATDIEADGERIRVGGIGGCHGPSNYERTSASLAGSARRHFTRDETEMLAATPDVDVVLLHNAPAGVEFTWRRPDGSVRRVYASEAEGLSEALRATRPAVCFFGHHHTRIDADVDGIPCVGVNAGPHPGSLVAVDVLAGGQWRHVAEWPERT